MHSITVKSNRDEQFLDVTPNLKKLAMERGGSGLMTAYVSHTTAGITINEGADPDVIADILDALREIAPRNRSWKHSEGNADAHVKASLIGSSVNVIVQNGELVLGTWQKIFFGEFDGPRSRNILVSFVPSK